MVLDLNGMDNHKIQATIVHEFGHSFGLGHEHQHPDYWTNMEWFLDVDGMIECAGKNYNHYINQYGPLGQDVYKSSFDPHSVMHYP